MTIALKSFLSSFLGRLPTPVYIPVVGAMIAVLKTLLAPVVSELNLAVFVPFGLGAVFPIEPLPWLAGHLAASAAELGFLSLDSLSVVCHFLVSGVLLPLVATLLAQLIPQHVMARWIASERQRALIASLTMGVLYAVAYGQVALVIAGSVVGIPLVFIFFQRMRAVSAFHAYLVTSGIHMIANSAIVLCRLLLGGI